MNEFHRILCIEDDARERAALITILSGSGYEVWGAANGSEGLELAAKQPDLIILDVGLPDINGLEVCRRIKANADTRHIPVLHLSGQFTEDEDRAAGLDGGADAYLVKATANSVLMATVRSLLRMRDAEQSLAVAVRKAEAANAAKTRFLERITLHLRTPLNAIIGTSGLLMDSALSARQREHAVSIKRSADRLLTLVNDVLDATRLDMRNVAIEITDLDPRLVCTDVFELLRDRAEVKHIALEYDVSAAVPSRVQADAGRLRQVLVHLVDNAVKFTPAGTITVRVCTDPPTEHGPVLRVEVADTGCGVPPEQEGDLFAPLAPLERGDSAASSGPGLGLAIARAIVELMGGSIGYRKGAPCGSVFWLTLPVHTAARTSPTPGTEATGPSDVLTGLHVLVVDDNRVNLKVAQGLLRSLGCDVTLADSGEMALGLTQCETFDTILMDLTMPGMDGVETTQRIRASERAAGTSRTPIIAVTAQTDEASRIQCYAADMDGYVPKPVDREILADAIREHMRVAGAAPAAADSPAQPAETAGADAVRVFDSADLYDRLGGDREAVCDILHLFLSDVQADVDLLDQGARERDAQQVMRQAHSLKGALANVGAEAAQRAAAALETAGKREDWDAIPSLIAALTAAIALARPAIRKEADRLTDELGSTVEVESSAANAGHESPAAPRQTLTGPVRALICDDSVAMRHSLMRVLDGYPVEVIGQAENPDEAIRLIEQLSPELVFLDVVMPEGTGIDVLRRIRELPHPPLTVMLSSVAERDTVFESRRLGAVDYLLKPFDSATLKTCIERVYAKLRGE